MAADDVTLLARAQQLEPDAWTEIYDQFYPRIYGFLLTRVRDGMLAEDLAADVFVNALRAIPSYEERGLGLAVWLLRIAHNRLIDHLRQSGSQASDSLDEQDLVERIAEDTGKLQESQLSDSIDLQTAVQQLNSDQRQVIHLRFVEGLTSQQVASILGKSEAAVKIIQHRALKALKAMLIQKPVSA